MIERRRQVFALPTNKESILVQNAEGRWFYFPHRQPKVGLWKPHHLYFIAPSILEDKVNGEEVKDGEASIDISTNTLIPKTERGYGRESLRKIIATNNSDLWYRRTASNLRGEILEQEGVFKIPESFIELFAKEQGIWEVEMQYENIRTGHPKTMYELIATLDVEGFVYVRPVKKELYPKDEMLKACFQAFNHQIGILPNDTVSFEEWKREWFDKRYPK